MYERWKTVRAIIEGDEVGALAIWAEEMQKAAGSADAFNAVLNILRALELGYIRAQTSRTRWEWLRDVCGYRRRDQSVRDSDMEWARRKLEQQLDENRST